MVKVEKSSLHVWSVSWVVIHGYIIVNISKYDKNVDITLHAQVLASSYYMVVKSGYYDRLLTKNNFHLGFSSNKYLIIYILI